MVEAKSCDSVKLIHLNYCYYLWLCLITIQEEFIFENHGRTLTLTFLFCSIVILFANTKREEIHKRNIYFWNMKNALMMKLFQLKIISYFFLLLCSSFFCTDLPNKNINRTNVCEMGVFFNSKIIWIGWTGFEDGWAADSRSLYAFDSGRCDEADRWRWWNIQRCILCE